MNAHTHHFSHFYVCTRCCRPFTAAADKGADLQFEQMFYNGLSDWQDEVETVYENPDGSASSNLKNDAAKVNEFYLGPGKYGRVSWPGELPNFASCAANTAMCCWPKDRQANDNNGNCATPYDTNCVDKDVADNTNLCFANLNASTQPFQSASGFMAFPDDNANGEGAIHCHGFAWDNNEYDASARYKANNLFYVSMYDHMYVRGYVKNIPGMPMCGCIEQMPIVTRSDCTQINLSEDWVVEYDGANFVAKLTKVEINFAACQGRNNRNNDLWAYAARLYDEKRLTPQQFGQVGRVITDDSQCYHATEYAKHQKGYVTGYEHDRSMYTKVAGRDNMYERPPMGREAFKKAFFQQTLTAPSSLEVTSFAPGETPIIMRICPDCTATHRKIWYRRLTPVPANFDLLSNILTYYSGTVPVGNKWKVDFSLHSSYEDAVSGANPWSCPNDTFNYYAPFVGNCSPSGASVTEQYSHWDWTPGPRPNVAYYINKPEDIGLQDYSDVIASTGDIAGLTDIDIGYLPGATGNSWEDDGVYYISGPGLDIWGQSDSFHYLSQPYSGDIDVSVRVATFANPNQWAKAGIMLRANNSPSSPYAFMMLAGKEGITSQNRHSTGRYSETAGSQFKTTPPQTTAWLRIVKKLEKFEFYRSEDGVEWKLHSTDTIFFPDDSYRVGLAVSANDWWRTVEATFEDYSIEEYNFPSAAPSISSAPTGWSPLVDIGEPQRDGKFYKSNDGTIDYLQGSGTGLWGSSDSFAFLSTQELKANGSVEMYIKNFSWGNIYSRGGLMIRNTNDANSANVFLGAAGKASGAVFQSRAATGAKTVNHAMNYVNWQNSMWVKLEYTAAGVITAYYKEKQTDTYKVLGSATMNMTGNNILIGRAVSAGTDYQWAMETLETQFYAIS